MESEIMDSKPILRMYSLPIKKRKNGGWGHGFKSHYNVLIKECPKSPKIRHIEWYFYAFEKKMKLNQTMNKYEEKQTQPQWIVSKSIYVIEICGITAHDWILNIDKSYPKGIFLNKTP